MKKILGGIVCGLFALVPVWGFDNSLEAKNGMLAEIGVHAKKVQLDAENVSQHLRSKQMDLAFLKDKINATGDDISKLQQLVKDFELRNFGLSEQHEADWELLTTKVQLLSVFYDSKKEIIQADNPEKNKAVLRSNAKALGVRAAKLQETAGRLQK